MGDDVKIFQVVDYASGSGIAWTKPCLRYDLRVSELVRRLKVGRNVDCYSI